MGTLEMPPQARLGLLAAWPSLEQQYIWDTEATYTVSKPKGFQAVQVHCHAMRKGAGCSFQRLSLGLWMPAVASHSSSRSQFSQAIISMYACLHEVQGSWICLNRSDEMD